MLLRSSTPHSDKPHRFPSSITGKQAKKTKKRRKTEKNKPEEE
jgi:hypothetical protein